MKRPKKRSVQRNARHNHRQRKKHQHEANLSRVLRRSAFRHRQKHRTYYHQKEIRENLKRQLYQKVEYIGEPVLVAFENEIGIEAEDGAMPFLTIASKFIDFRGKELVFDLKSCTRVWPSTITLLCSLWQWVSMTSKPVHRLKIRSTSSQHEAVNSYLAHSGLYAYVGRPDDSKGIPYPNDEVVRIEHETSASKIVQRDQEIEMLLKNHSRLTKDEIELFVNKVVIEVLNNITEHGVNYRDKGWWMIAQKHPIHGFISLCLADNGIGIRHSLTTGPQRSHMPYENESGNDGKYIELAMTQTISGAVAAMPKEVSLWKKRPFPAGARRGNGLKRIRDACRKLRIPFKLLSHHGYVFLDEGGDITHAGAFNSRVFAGTMFHFIIPARAKEE